MIPSLNYAATLFSLLTPYHRSKKILGKLSEFKSSGVRGNNF